MFEFGSFRLEVSERRLLRGGRRIRLEPKQFEVLALLVEKSPSLVHHHELLKLWGDVHIGPGSLKTCIYELRKIIGGECIIAERKGGYRFVRAVTRRGLDGTGELSGSAAEDLASVKVLVAPSTSEPAVALAPALHDKLLRDYDYCCSICHLPFEVDLYAVDPSESGRDLQYNNLVALCNNCVSLARRKRMTPARLRDIADLWRRRCAQVPGQGLTEEEAETAYSQALRLSLSNDILDVKRAAVICKSILHYHPFHEYAEVLLLRLGETESRLDFEDKRRDLRARSTADEVNRRMVYERFLILSLLAIVIYNFSVILTGRYWRWLPLVISVAALPTLFLLCRRLLYVAGARVAVWHAFVEEYLHLFSIYVFSPVRNAFYRRMPLRKYSDFIEMDADGKTFTSADGHALRATFRGAIDIYLETGRLPGFAVNYTRMCREFYTDVDPSLLPREFLEPPFKGQIADQR